MEVGQTNVWPWLALLVLTVAFSIPPVAADDSACDRPKVLTKERFFEKARDAYNALLEAKKPPFCASQGLSDLSKAWATHKAEIGAGYANARDYENALKAYGEALALNPTATEISKAIKVTRLAHAESKIQLGKAYAAAGDAEKSAGAFKEALELEPGNRTAAQALREIRLDESLAKVKAYAELGEYGEAAKKFVESRGKNPNITLPKDRLGFDWQRWRGNVLAVLVATGELIAVSFILFVLARRLVIRYVYRPILGIDSFGSDELSIKAGPGFAAALQGVYYDLAQGSAAAPVKLRVKQSVQRAQVPDTTLGKVVPSPVSWLQALPAFLASILPRKAYTVTGALHKSTTHGAGVTVQLAGESSGSYTFWEVDYIGNAKKTFPVKSPVDPGPYYHLADYVATWLLSHLMGTKFNLLGTKNWRAYAMFQAGLNAEASEDSGAARDLYVKALRFDSNFAAAILNLALLANDPKQYHLTLEYLKRAADNSARTDPTRYQARFMYAARLYETGKAAVALAEGQALVNDINATLDKVRLPLPLRYAYKLPLLRPDVEDSNGELETYLNGLQPIAEAMLAGLNIANGLDLKTEISKLDRIAKRAATPLVHYNLACSYSMATAKAGPTQATVQTDAFKNSLKSVETALLLNPDFAPDFNKDKSLKEVRTSQVKIGRETVENLFKKILQQYGTLPPAPAPLELETLPNIGEQYAEALEKQGIKTTGELINAAATAAKRARLAVNLGVGLNKVTRWAMTVDMVSISGIDLQKAALLNEAGVYSLDELQTQTGKQLFNDVMDSAITLKDSKPPARSIVDAWVTAAASAPRRVT